MFLPFINRKSAKKLTNERTNKQTCTCNKNCKRQCSCCILLWIWKSNAEAALRIFLLCLQKLFSKAYLYVLYIYFCYILYTLFHFFILVASFLYFFCLFLSIFVYVHIRTRLNSLMFSILYLCSKTFWLLNLKYTCFAQYTARN